MGSSACCAFVIAALGVAPEARPHPTRSAWSYAALIDRISGTRVTVPDGRIRIDRALVICNGEGRAIRRGGVRRWKHFTCTQTLFDRNRVDRDLTFRVHVLGRTRFLVTNTRYGPD
jgi:hypothetical protein